jgi:glycosyltransferase involved in cell wall biosynthesis
VKIGVNARFLLPKTHLEGIGKYTYEILFQLCKQHAEHTFYFFFDRPFDKKYIFSDNIVPVVLHPQARHPILFTIWFEWSVRRKMKALDIDVFLSFDGLSALTGSFPEVLVVHDIVFAHKPSYLPWLNRWYLRLVMPRLLKKASRIVTVSQFVKEDVCHHFDIDPSKVNVAYNALPTAFTHIITDTPRPADFPYFIVPGAIIERKNTLNILIAFEAFKQNDKQGFKLVFAGRFMFKPGKEVSLLWQKLTEKGDLIHLNKPNDKEMVQWVQHAKALIYASLFEGFGIPILEGMACGVPVITSNITSMPEVAGDAAFCLDPHSSQEITRAMQWVVEPANGEEMIRRGYLQIKKFNWANSAAVVYENLVQACANGKNKGPQW